MDAAHVDTVIEDDRWDVLDLPSLATRACDAALSHLGAAGGIAVLGCDDTRIAALNAGFRGRPVATNVLSWPSAERGASLPGGPPEPPHGEDLGDIAIAYDTCIAEAAAAGRPAADHVTHLLVHATLHLLGYDHEGDADAALMERTEVAVLATLGLPDPYDAR